MPTYQYECTECGDALEVHQSFSDEPLTTCPSCSGRLRKVYNAVGVVFKGSGFYRTDSRKAESNGSSPAQAAPKAAEPSSGKSPGKSSGKSPSADSKSASSGTSKATTSD